MITLRPSPRALAARLLSAVVLLDVAYAATQFLRFHYGVYNYPVRVFDLDCEQSLPTVFSFLILLSCAFTLVWIAAEERQAGGRGWHAWAGLAAIFLFLAGDETLEIHEKLGLFLSRFYHSSGILYFAWIVPYGVLTLLVATIYLRFLFQLPRPIAWRFVVAASLYVGGAIGVEMVGGSIVSSSDDENPLYVIVSGIEENLELLGAILFLCTLVRYVAQRQFRLTLAPAPSTGSGAQNSHLDQSCQPTERASNPRVADGLSQGTPAFVIAPGSPSIANTDVVAAVVAHRPDGTEDEEPRVAALAPDPHPLA